MSLNYRYKRRDCQAWLDGAERTQLIASAVESLAPQGARRCCSEYFNAMAKIKLSGEVNQAEVGRCHSRNPQ
ncbi:MAG: hypothetical protein P8L85_11150 [Rubripirellula sp.]|nr:hypothetical protein [Rubripirellula sp.]